MSVSNQIDTIVIPKRKHVVKAVQWDIDNIVPDNSTPAVAPVWNQSKKIRKPLPPSDIKQLNYIPLLIDQKGNRQVTSWGTPHGVQLMVPKDVSLPVPMPDYSSYNPELYQYPYHLGTKGGPIAIKFDSIVEPTKMIYHTDNHVHGNIREPITTYNVGLKEYLG